MAGYSPKWNNNDPHTPIPSVQRGLSTFNPITSLMAGAPPWRKVVSTPTHDLELHQMYRVTGWGSMHHHLSDTELGIAGSTVTKEQRQAGWKLVSTGPNAWRRLCTRMCYRPTLCTRRYDDIVDRYVYA